MALMGDSSNCDLVILHAAIGHDLKELAGAVQQIAPRARVFGASCCGVVGKEGVSESMKDIGLMAVRGNEFVTAHVEGINGGNSLEKCRELGRSLRMQNAGIKFIYFMAPGIDIANDECIQGIEAEVGSGVTIFGATASDNMRGLVCYQSVDQVVSQHVAFAIGFCDETLEIDTQATHGFVAVGAPLIVTRCEANRIFELNGRPAWSEYTSRLGLAQSATCGDSIPVGALAEKLSPELALEYGNEHLLRVVTSRDGDVMHYATTCVEGTPLWLTVRDEERIFSEMDRMMKTLGTRAQGQKAIAVFHADCLARGRFMFNRVLKEELVGRMQHALASGSECPAWLGMYGFGEFARLGGKNEYHNYTTALGVIYRRSR